MTKLKGPSRPKVASRFIEEAHEGKFDEATKDFDVTMAAAMPADAVKALWQSWEGEYGKFKVQLEAKTAVLTQEFTIVTIPCKFEKANRDLEFVFDQDWNICGLADKMNAADFPVAPYASPSSFWDEDVTFGDKDWLLPGSISVPLRSDHMPAVVLVHGSGPNDRDETVASVKPFRDLAWGLASRGIVVLRYEKRTKEHSQKIAKVIDKLTVKEETIDDALAAVQWLKTNKHVDSTRIFVLGHSLGGMLIPRIAQQDPTSAGFIVMAGAARPLEDIILEQSHFLLSLKPEPHSEADKKSMEEIEANVAKVKDPNLSSDAKASGLPQNWPPSYWLDLRGYKPAEMAKAINKPLLILQAEKDYQVTEADYALWQEALAGKSNVTFKLYPGLSHPFTQSLGTPSPADYNTAQNVSATVIEDIADWVKKQKPSAPDVKSS
jgi:hypothetical protein